MGDVGGGSALGRIYKQVFNERADKIDAGETVQALNDDRVWQVWKKNNPGRGLNPQERQDYNNSNIDLGGKAAQGQAHGSGVAATRVAEDKARRAARSSGGRKRSSSNKLG